MKLLCSNYFWPFQVQLCLHLFCTWNQKEQLYLCSTCFCLQFTAIKNESIEVSVQLCIVLRLNAFVSHAMSHMLWLTEQCNMLTILEWDGWIAMKMPLQNWVMNCSLLQVFLYLVLLPVQCHLVWSVLIPMCQLSSQNVFSKPKN